MLNILDPVRWLSKVLKRLVLCLTPAFKMKSPELVTILDRQFDFQGNNLPMVLLLLGATTFLLSCCFLLNLRLRLCCDCPRAGQRGGWTALLCSREDGPRLGSLSLQVGGCFLVQTGLEQSGPGAPGPICKLAGRKASDLGCA